MAEKAAAGQADAERLAREENEQKNIMQREVHGLERDTEKKHVGGGPTAHRDDFERRGF